MLEKYCTSMFWMDFKTFSPKPISCNFRRTTVPKLWKENSKNENKNWNQGFFTEMRLKYFSQESCQSIAFLWKDSKISFEKKKVWSGITLPSDLWCRDVRLPGLQNVTDLIDTSAQKYSSKKWENTCFTYQANFRVRSNLVWKICSCHPCKKCKLVQHPSVLKDRCKKSV